MFHGCLLAPDTLLAQRLYNGIKKNRYAQFFPTLKISLAQWSLHHAIESGAVNAKDFAAIAIHDYGLDAVEYVNGFYKEKASDEKFWNQMRASSDQYGVSNLLIMVDEEGDLGSQGSDRKKAVENHYKWINAAKILGCHSILL